MEYHFYPIRRLRKKQRGQSTLETVIAMILMIVLIGGIMNIWFWANKQIAKRQRAYNGSRRAAGRAEGGNYYLTWPVYRSEPLQEGVVLVDAPRIKGGSATEESSHD